MFRSEDEKDLLFKTFAGITSLITSGRDNRIIFHRILDSALELLPSRKIYLIFLDGDRIVKYTAQLQDRGKRVSVEDMPQSTGILNWLQREVEDLRASEMVFSLDLSILAAEAMKEEADQCGHVISAPLMAKNSLFGIILAINEPAKRSFSEDDIHLLTIMANQVAIALENYQLYKKLEMESITDGLTGVYNYRFLIKSIKLEMKRAKRFNYKFSFVMLDVDNLKAYNDQNGHLSGSKALKDIARILVRNCREIDLVAKYGGDEFGLLLPQTDILGAVRLSKRILPAVEDFMFDSKTQGLLTCSMGIAVYPDDARDIEEIIEKADAALYRAKSTGKNSIRTYKELSLINPS